jgi:two-component system cell cycle response regulator
MRILIAEDDDASRLILQVAVELFGHQCLIARDGLEAWQMFQEAEIDVVISDWVMPKMDGMEFCRRVRSHAGPAYTYFIFLTSLTKKPDLLRGIHAGADDYLHKPLDRAELGVRLLVAERITALHRRLASQALQLEHLNRQLFEQGRTDSLTKLGNRLRLNEDMEALLGRSARYSQSYCAVLCDIDRFKLYNDTHGHLAGDEVLRMVAGTLQQGCRSGDAAYRYGGEEFLLILPEQSTASATAAAERYRRAVELLAIPHEANPPGRVVTISAGVALISPSEQVKLPAWLNRADAALYDAKQSGRNRVVAYEQSVECLT